MVLCVPKIVYGEGDILFTSDSDSVILLGSTDADLVEGC